MARTATPITRSRPSFLTWLVRRLVVLTVLFAAGYVAGLVMQETGVPEQTRYLVGVIASVAVFVIGVVATGRPRTAKR